MTGLTDLVKSANTHAVGWASVAVGCMALCAPSVLHWLVPTVPADVIASVQQAGQIVAAICLGGAFIGRPPGIPASPPETDGK